MLAGRFRGYSVQRLMRFLVAIGHHVEIVVKLQKRGTAEVRVSYSSTRIMRGPPRIET